MIPHASKVIECLVETISSSFKDYSDNEYCGYQVGSTLRGISGYPVDLDMWLVNIKSDSDEQIQRLDNLLDCMSNGKAKLGVVDASDERTRSIVQKSIFLVNQIFPEVDIVSQFAIGPVPQPSRPQPTIYVQFCGPLSLIENTHFFNTFPFHGRCFLDLNQRLFGHLNLDEIVCMPSPTYDDLLKWTAFLSLRAKTFIYEFEYIACLKKILMNYSAFYSAKEIYSRTDFLLQSYLSNRDAVLGFNQACVDIKEGKNLGLNSLTS